MRFLSPSTELSLSAITPMITWLRKFFLVTWGESLKLKMTQGGNSRKLKVKLFPPTCSPSRVHLSRFWFGDQWKAPVVSSISFSSPPGKSKWWQPVNLLQLSNSPGRAPEPSTWSALSNRSGNAPSLLNPWCWWCACCWCWWKWPPRLRRFTPPSSNGPAPTSTATEFSSQGEIRPPPTSLLLATWSPPPLPPPTRPIWL